MTSSSPLKVVSTTDTINDDTSAENLAFRQNAIDAIIANLSSLYPHVQKEVIDEVVKIMDRGHASQIDKLQKDLAYYEQHKLAKRKRRFFIF